MFMGNLGVSIGVISDPGAFGESGDLSGVSGDFMGSKKIQK